MATATTTVTNVLDLVKEDLMERFVISGSTSVLIDYTNRIQQMVLVEREWDWMTSGIKKFITELGRTDYWIGATAGQSAGQVDTALNLTDVRQVRQAYTAVRSAYKELYPTLEPPMHSSWHKPDGTYAPSGAPKVFRNDEGTPNVLSLYPAPDTGNTYEIIPEAPILTIGSGGALAARTYFVALTFVDEANNEGSLSEIARQFVRASNLITVKAPVAGISAGTSGIRYNQYNVYAGTSESSLTLQNASPTAIASDYTEAAGGITSTLAAPPSSSAIEPLRGYIVEFRYYKARGVLDAGADVLQIPDDYRDVVVAGVNWLASRYFHDDTTSQFWQQMFRDGIRRMVKDQPHGLDFIMPDPAARPYRLQGDSW